MNNQKIGGIALLLTVVMAACFSEHVTSAQQGTDIEKLCGANPGSNVVQIKNLAFNPAQLAVTPGTRVTWANCDDDIHSTTSDSNAWDSGMLSPRTVYSRTMDAAGSFAYHCEPHPFMTATVRVQ
jgi:plastocyanin